MCVMTCVYYVYSSLITSSFFSSALSSPLLSRLLFSSNLFSSLMYIGVGVAIGAESVSLRLSGRH